MGLTLEAKLIRSSINARLSSSASQNRFTSDYGTISDRVLLETLSYMKHHPIFLFLPSTYEDATKKIFVNQFDEKISDEEIIDLKKKKYSKKRIAEEKGYKEIGVFDNILENIRELQEEHKCFDTIVLGLDTADTEKKFREVHKKFANIPRSKILWNNSPEMQQLYKEIGRDQGITIEPGKGRNMWTALGYRLMAHPVSSFILHDCDILPEYYGPHMILSLAAPLVHPAFEEAKFSKAYYNRLKRGKNGQFELSGRVRRLLVGPLLDALNENYVGKGNKDFENKMLQGYFSFMRSFKYPLAGEFGMRAKLANDMRVQPDFGIEISILNNLFHSDYQIAQVDLGLYGHKHQQISPDDPKKGLNRMSEEIAKTLFRKMHTIANGQILDKDHFGELKGDFDKFSRIAIGHYRRLSKTEGWSYNEAKEHEHSAIFWSAVERAFDTFCNNPDEIPPLPGWDVIARRYEKRLLGVVDKYNKK